MNLYRYCGNGPTDGTDPSGCIVKITCQARTAFIQWLENHGIQLDAPAGTWPIPSPDGNYALFEPSFVVRPASNAGRNVDEEIATEMIKSNWTFWVDGDTEAQAMRAWNGQVFTRKSIVQPHKAIAVWEPRHWSQVRWVMDRHQVGSMEWRFNARCNCHAGNGHRFRARRTRSFRVLQFRVEAHLFSRHSGRRSHLSERGPMV